MTTCPICKNVYTRTIASKTSCLERGCLERCMEFLDLEFPKRVMVLRLADGKAGVVTASDTDDPQEAELRAWAIAILSRPIA